jgi:hypothetical protein
MLKHCAHFANSFEMLQVDRNSCFPFIPEFKIEYVNKIYIKNSFEDSRFHQSFWDFWSILSSNKSCFRININTNILFSFESTFIFLLLRDILYIYYSLQNGLNYTLIKKQSDIIDLINKNTFALVQKKISFEILSCRKK